MTIWFSSDHHFNHANIIKYCNRPFGTVQIMNDALIQLHNQVVSPDDTFICVGDLSLGWPGAEYASSRMNGHKILIPGNHDKCWPYSSKGFKWPSGAMKRYNELGWVLGNPEEIKEGPDGQQYLISHLPYEKDERHGERYAEFRPEDGGLPHITGHVHDLWHTSGREFNVGVDVNHYAPVAFETICEWRHTL